MEGGQAKNKKASASHMQNAKASRDTFFSPVRSSCNLRAPPKKGIFLRPKNHAQKPQKAEREGFTMRLQASTSYSHQLALAQVVCAQTSNQFMRRTPATINIVP